jgi:hypothetical protein
VYRFCPVVVRLVPSSQGMAVKSVLLALAGTTSSSCVFATATAAAGELEVIVKVHVWRLVVVSGVVLRVRL